MKKYIVTLISLFSIITAQAQINKEIKKQSDQNQQDRSEQQTNSYSSGDEYSDADACIDGCMLAIDLAELFADGIVALANQQEKIVARDSENDRITSFQATLDIGAVPNYSQVLIPRIRGNYGIFSSEMRFFDNIEKRLQSNEHYSTFDWQVLIFNLASHKNFNLSVGNGYMTEHYSGLHFHEWSTTMDIYTNNRWRINFEVRTATDYKTRRNIRREATGGLYYAIKQTPKLSFYGNLKGFTAKYYDTVSLNSLMFGTSLTVY